MPIRPNFNHFYFPLSISINVSIPPSIHLSVLSIYLSTHSKLHLSSYPGLTFLFGQESEPKRSGLKNWENLFTVQNLSNKMSICRWSKYHELLKGRLGHFTESRTLTCSWCTDKFFNVRCTTFIRVLQNATKSEFEIWYLNPSNYMTEKLLPRPFCFL